MPGQIRIRVRYHRYVTPWFDYLLVSPQEMEDILDGTGWRLARTIACPDALITGPYIAIIEREAA
jgi:hypothetical protein